MKSVYAVLLPMLAGILTFWACATTPETDRRQLMLVNQGQMSELGEQAYQKMKAETPVMPDNQLTAAVQEITNRITQVVDQDFDWEITIFDSPERNAFCLPGGKMGIYAGMLELATTNANVAAILGHEIAHATTRHGAERLSQGLVAQGLLTLTNISLDDNKYRNLIMGALGLGVQVGVMLPYSRKQETEADHIGTLYMAEAGYDPQAAVEIWQKMQQAGGSAPPEFLSTHPNPASRIDKLQNDMGRYKKARQNADIPITTKELPALDQVAH